MTRWRFIECFGGCLPAAAHGRKLLLKSLRRLNGQRDASCALIKDDLPRHPNREQYGDKGASFALGTVLPSLQQED
ncbi:hypothetical protein DRW41_21355 [Neobacillus piezotolerans]|uniref:Uncharacterized protein n=1 Tax=Neobacillus piezotolerans TaxID=2259171 RepID=A0A3D8GK83_9BACI|nr:hypothetical protein DRW41_21355 [Neobacillus piezotolerans]